MTEATPIGSPGIGHNGPPSEIDDPAFWFPLINEKAAAVFLDLTPRSMQAMRQRGGGPRFVRISARCVKYRRSQCPGTARSSTQAGLWLIDTVFFI